MRELTGQRVAIGIIVALVLTVLFTYTEEDATRPSAMIVLHNQTGNPLFANRSLDAARASSIPDLYYYQLANGQTRTFEVTEVGGYPASTLRPREIYSVTVRVSGANTTTVGSFAFRNERVEQAWVSVFSTIFIILVWFFGVTAFAGPVMVLVVIPIERMVRLLTMIMSDPLGYESTLGYKIFMDEEESITKNTRWTKEVLKGMETSFLMSTILRIGSLMKVGFGSAGVEIIRNNLEKGQSKNMLVLSSQGSSVACIFLFCDIRQFTDATECLQEEVFVFTNRIAAVVHSICHSYGGSANKNIGDAFLLSWLLEEEPNTSAAAMNGLRSSVNEEAFVAKYNQADKALLSVVKICMALHYDDFYVRGMSDGAREALMTKLAKRKGPVVQMGFGLHAGKAVQGAIGSQRKIDATYVSEHVERAEFLESSTKKYGVKMLMSDSFHRLLHPGNRRRCRKIDQILIQDEDDAEDDYLSGDGKIIELLTFDMDIDALWKSKGSDKKVGGRGDATPETDSAELGSDKGAKREAGSSRLSQGMLRRLSVARQSLKDGGSDEFVSEAFALPPVTGLPHEKKDGDGPPAELVLPTGPALYNANVWVSEDMRRIRQKYSDGLFFQKFSSGLQAYYARDWEHARHCFVTVLDLFEDGPSRYFLNQIEKSNGVPPRDFKGYGVA
jgi:class 3 adenylate cyclase